jgi:hypothetical protein
MKWKLLWKRKQLNKQLVPNEDTVEAIAEEVNQLMLLF